MNMSKVVYEISMSLDGFISGANARPEAGWAGLGDGGERLHDWGFNSADSRNREIAEATGATTGAVIVGRTTYNHSILNWGADGPIGANVPTVIVSHSVPQDIPDGSVYTFVNSVEAALETAKKLAGDKDVLIHGGNIAQQLITLNLVDEIFIHLAPVLFGSGTRLIEDLGGEHVQLETTEVIETKEAIHLRFHVIK
jgi:dihydrofolate reductase